MNKKSIIAGNWKMNKTPSEGKVFIDEVQSLAKGLENTEIIFFPSFLGLSNIQVSEPFYLGAQNCHWEDSGAFTGEISIPMLIDCNVEYVIIGHSERRLFFNELDNDINKKIKAILASKLKPILCIGETIDDRNAMLTEKFLQNQLERALDGIKSLNECILAYEPIWAIGTGETASIDQISNTHNFIKSVLKKIYPESFNCPILYGGSVNPKNAKELIQVEALDGFLIGGASLNKESFVSIINSVEEN